MTISLGNEILQISIVVTIFLAIIALYVYVSNGMSKVREDTLKCIAETKAEWEQEKKTLTESLKELTKAVQDLQVQLADRLARIEASLGKGKPA